jgi:hypothetical protein
MMRRLPLPLLLAASAIGVPAMATAQMAAGQTDTTLESTGVYQRYPWLPRLLGAQVTLIGQDMPPFHAPYDGRNSLTDRGDARATHTYGVYIGSRVTPFFQVYIDAEMARGSGIGHAAGVAGLTDGDVIRQGSANLGQGPYLARAYARYLVPLGRARDTADRAQDQVPGAEPTTRLEIKAGLFALSDDLDLNRYAGSARTQFMDLALWDDAAWDYAADTRGYTHALLVGYVSPRWALKLAAGQMPTKANGNVFDDDLSRAYALNAELSLHPIENGTVVRVLVYDNHARMGVYRAAIDAARARDTTPDIVADDRKGRAKYGFGVNLEQPLADSGNTGAFLRLGWNDGKTEDFAFTEADRHVSGGLQLAGTVWHRPRDRVGFGAAIDGLSKDHEDYLAAGGAGFLLGDGRLRYGTENIIEWYYRFEVPHATFVQLSPAIQHIQNPGYNEDRGPLYIYTVRINLHY